MKQVKINRNSKTITADRALELLRVEVVYEINSDGALISKKVVSSNSPPSCIFGFIFPENLVEKFKADFEEWIKGAPFYEGESNEQIFSHVRFCVKQSWESSGFGSSGYLVHDDKI